MTDLFAFVLDYDFEIWTKTLMTIETNQTNSFVYVLKPDLAPLSSTDQPIHLHDDVVVLQHLVEHYLVQGIEVGPLV